MARAAVSWARMPEAPGRFSTNIGCPSVRDTPSAMSRAITSVAAPGPVGTISLIGRLGQVWLLKVSACAPPHSAIMAQQNAMRKKPVTLCTRAIPCVRPPLFRGLQRWRAHGLDAVRRGRRDRRAYHVARLVAGPRPAAMHGGAIVPHDDVAVLPLMLVSRAGRRRRRGELVDQLLARRPLHAFDRISVRGDVERAAAIDRITPHQAPAARRQRIELLRRGKPGGDLGARVTVVMPSERILEFLLQRRIKPLEGQPGRGEFGLAAVI